MHAVRKTRSVAFRALLLVLSLSLFSGCAFPDLGAFEDEQAYYDSLGKISIHGPAGTDSYSVEDDFYNDDIVENLTCHVPADRYDALTVQIEKQLNVSEIGLFVLSDTDVTLSVACFVREVHIDDFNRAEQTGTPLPGSTDPLFLGCLGQTDLALSAGVWDSFSFAGWNFDGVPAETLRLLPGDRVTFVFLNNTLWGQTHAFKSANLRMTGLLVMSE